MAGAGKTTSKGGADKGRAERVAAALRANLARRKAQARSRSEAATIDDTDASDAPESGEQT